MGNAATRRYVPRASQVTTKRGDGAGPVVAPIHRPWRKGPPTWQGEQGIRNDLPRTARAPTRGVTASGCCYYLAWGRSLGGHPSGLKNSTADSESWWVPTPVPSLPPRCLPSPGRAPWEGSLLHRTVAPAANVAVPPRQSELGTRQQGSSAAAGHSRRFFQPKPSHRAAWKQSSVWYPPLWRFHLHSLRNGPSHDYVYCLASMHFLWSSWVPLC